MKKMIKMIAAAATMAGLLAMGMMLITGCGGGGTTASEPEVVINPITGLEAEEALPARPVQVSIPNAPDGAVPQTGIAKADIIYEIPVEGQFTRLQAIYYTEFPETVGPIRSVRYYFVDIAREYKAAHVGYGWGKKAHSYMESCGIYHINGMQDTDLFYRSDKKQAPNDAFIDWSTIEKRADEEGWFEEEQTIKPWKFRDEQWKEEQKQAISSAKATVEELGKSDDPEDAKEVAKAEKLLAQQEKAVNIRVNSNMTSLNTSTCKYDEETGTYKRYWFGEDYIDAATGEPMEFSNILVQYVQSRTMTDSETGLADEKGRLEIDFNSKGEAMLFTEGKVVKGTWSKKDPDGRTVFKDENGKQFRFTPGKTWVYVIDQNMKCAYE